MKSWAENADFFEIKLQFIFCHHPLCLQGGFAQPSDEQNKSLRHLTCICLIEIKQYEISAGFNLSWESESLLFIALI